MVLSRTALCLHEKIEPSETADEQMAYCFKTRGWEWQRERGKRLSDGGELMKECVRLCVVLHSRVM